MKRKVKELKRIARGNLQGNFAELIRAFVFCNLIVSLIETPFSSMITETLLSTSNIIYIVALSLITIASVVLTVGQYCLHLSVARGDKVRMSDFFYPIKYDANRLILTEAILFVIRVIGLAPAIGAFVIINYYNDFNMYLIALALCILGCILTILIEVAFGMTYFALIDGEELSVIDAFKTALKLIKTHKGRFFYMQLSFIGMYALVLLTFGLGLLWVQPYIMQTTTVFYLDIKGELDEIIENQTKSEPTPEPTVIDTYA